MSLPTLSPTLLRFQNPAAETPLNPEHLEYLLQRGFSDITIRSIDGVFLYLHRKNLQAVTHAFNASEFLANSESSENVIALPERADILEIAFSFIYPNKHPKLRGLDVQRLIEIQDAVEKYKIYPAMHVCETRLM